MELKELIEKWEEQIAMHRRVVEDPLMFTKEDRQKSSHQTQALCAIMEDIKKLSIPRVVVSDADIALAAVSENVDLIRLKRFIQGAKWCRQH
jgi:hypothetical protein